MYFFCFRVYLEKSRLVLSSILPTTPGSMHKVKTFTYIGLVGLPNHQNENISNRESLVCHPTQAGLTASTIVPLSKKWHMFHLVTVAIVKNKIVIALRASMVVVTTDYMSLLFSKDTLLGCCFSCSKLFRKHTFELAVYASILVTIYLYSI